jgi:class 3 adenylate cyclase
MTLLRSLSIQSKLTVMMLLVAIVSIATIGWISYSNGKEALTACAFGELTSVRSSKKRQIEAFFKTIRNEVSNLADDRMIVSFTRELSDGFSKLKTAKISPEWDRKVTSYYRDEYLPKLAQATGETPRLEAFLPKSPEARYAQYLYIANNKYPAAERHKLRDPGDGSEFSAAHARYHTILSKLVLDMGYDNMVIVDQNTGDVLYTFGKSQIFGTNLLTGPYSHSTAADLFKSIRSSQNAAEVQVADFVPAAYSTGKPVALMGAPILDGPDQIGVLFLQFPLDEINRLMTDNFQWEAAGMGKTGKSYLVGPDMLMRSTARALYENPAKFYAGMQAAGYSTEDLSRVRRSGVATLALPIRATYVQDALEGKSGTAIAKNYLGADALISYAPLDIRGLRWVIVSEMSLDEAFASLTRLNRSLLIWAIVLVVAVTVASAFLGKRFVDPIFRLVDGARRLKAGEKNVSVAIGSRDEFADLGEFFNYMSGRITSMDDLVSRTARERDDLITGILPDAAAARMKEGHDQANDEFTEVSILYATISPSREGGVPLSAQKSLALLHDLIVAIDDAAERRGVEKLSANGVTYIAVCGMSRQRLDQSSRILDFAQDIQKAIHRLNRDRQAQLEIRIGIDSGPASGGVLGKTRVSYYLSGSTMATSRALAGHAPEDGVLVSGRIFTSTENLYLYNSPVQVLSAEGEARDAWPLASKLSWNSGAPHQTDAGASEAGGLSLNPTLRN